MRSIDSKIYQEFLKKQVFKYKLLKSKEIKLFTQMEMATLFFCQTLSDLYLKEGGEIAYLMPISVITAAEQHQQFKLFKKPAITLMEILYFEQSLEIFSLPVCVLIGLKGGKLMAVSMEEYQGKIDKHNRNARLDKVQLTVSTKNYSPPIIPKKSEFSDY